MSFQRVCAAADLSEDKPARFDVDGTDVVVVDLRDPATLTARPLVVTGLPGQRVVAASRLSRAGKGAADAGESPSVLVPLAPATSAVVETTLPESATLVRFAANPG